MFYSIIANNPLSCLNLLFGFLSIIFSLRGNFILSGWWVIFALFSYIIEKKILCLNKKTEFDKEFNSLVNLLTFGIAPLVLVYKNFEKFNFWQTSILFLYLLCSILRLVRLNISPKEKVISYSLGLPIIASAGLLAISVILVRRYSLELKLSTVGALIVILSLLMVSQIRYPNFQDLKRRKIIWLFLIGLVLLNILGEALIWFLFLAYILSPFLRRIKFDRLILFDKIKKKSVPG